MQEEIQNIAGDINQLAEAHQERLAEEVESNKSLEVAQTIQKFLSQNKSIFMSMNSQQFHQSSQYDQS
jgi:hypothetical protein